MTLWRYKVSSLFVLLRSEIIGRIRHMRRVIKFPTQLWRVTLQIPFLLMQIILSDNAMVVVVVGGEGHILPLQRCVKCGKHIKEA